MDSDPAPSGSFYSASPESKTTVYTPVNGPFDDCYPHIVPSDAEISLQNDAFGTWKPLSRFFHSPSRSQQTKFLLNAPYPIHDNAIENESEQLGSHLSARTTADFGSPDSRGTSDQSTLFSDFSAPRTEICGFNERYQNEDDVNHVEYEDEGDTGNNVYDITGSFPCFVPHPSQDSGDWAVSPTRYLRISKIDVSTPPATIFKLLQQEESDLQGFNVQNLKSDGTCLASYGEIRCAIAAYFRMRRDTHWAINFCSSAYFVMVMGESNTDIMCSVTSIQCTRNTPFILFNAFSDFGTVARFSAVNKSKKPLYRIAFVDPSNGSDAIDTLDGQYYEGLHLEVVCCEQGLNCQRMDLVPSGRTAASINDFCISSPQHRDLDILCPQPIRPSLDVSLHQSPSTNVSHNQEYSYEDETFGDMMSSSKSEIRSLVSTSSSKYSHSSQTYRQLPHSRSPKVSSSSQGSTETISDKFTGSHTVPGKNVIDLDRIACGLDTRTTVMLRNIPNKVDQQTLKEYIDETSKGLYNFLYLRIDFRNICNVGYAFINFLDPLDIIKFVKEKSGTRWNKFNSEKVLDVTYANIQGIDQLVEKFRNSSVMDQDPSYRPRLYHSSGPFSGTEMEFPAPNNILKKCRSISAAQQIGLFAPKMSTTSKGIWRKRD